MFIPANERRLVALAIKDKSLFFSPLLPVTKLVGAAGIRPTADPSLPALGHSSELSWGHPDNGEAASAVPQDLGSIAWTAQDMCILPLGVRGLDTSLFALHYCSVKWKKGKCPCLEMQTHCDINGTLEL